MSSARSRQFRPVRPLGATARHAWRAPGCRGCWGLWCAAPQLAKVTREVANNASVLTHARSGCAPLSLTTMVLACLGNHTSHAPAALDTVLAAALLRVAAGEARSCPSAVALR